MALRKIKEFTTNGANTAGRRAVVYRNAEWQEFQTKFYIGFGGVWVHQKKADFHTDDKGDALTTAASWVNKPQQVGAAK